MEKLANAQLIESSSLYLDLSENVLNEIDLYLSNTDLTKKQKAELIHMLELVYSEAYTNSIVDSKMME